jgi:hypothetical protein
MNLLIGLVSVFSIGLTHVRNDTTDNWHIFYNDKLIAFYNQADRNPPITLDKKKLVPQIYLRLNTLPMPPADIAKLSFMFLTKN